MDDLRQKIAAEEENINRVLANLKKGTEIKTRTVIELAAMGSFLCNIYNGIENILKQVLRAEGKRISNSGDWHKNLIKFSTAIGVISEESSTKLYDYLGFRHYFVHGYVFNLDWDRMKSLVGGIEGLWQEIKNQINGFINKI